MGHVPYTISYLYHTNKCYRVASGRALDFFFFCGMTPTSWEFQTLAQTVSYFKIIFDTLLEAFAFKFTAFFLIEYK